MKTEEEVRRYLRSRTPPPAPVTGQEPIATEESVRAYLRSRTSRPAAVAEAEPGTPDVPPLVAELRERSAGDARWLRGMPRTPWEHHEPDDLHAPPEGPSMVPPPASPLDRAVLPATLPRPTAPADATRAAPLAAPLPVPRVPTMGPVEPLSPEAFRIPNPAEPDLPILEAIGRAGPRLGARMVEMGGHAISAIGGLPDALIEPEYRSAGRNPVEDFGQWLAEGGELIGRDFQQSESVQRGGVRLTSPRWWAENAPEVVAQLGLQVGLAMATGGASATAQFLAFAAPTAVLEGGEEYKQVHDRILANGGSDADARAAASGAAVITGIVNAAVEKLGFDAIVLNRIPGLGKALATTAAGQVARIGLGAGAESLEEVVQTVVSRGNEFIATQDPKSFEGIGQELKAGAALGAFGGGVAAGGMVARDAVERSEAPPARLPGWEDLRRDLGIMPAQRFGSRDFPIAVQANVTEGVSRGTPSVTPPAAPESRETVLPAGTLPTPPPAPPAAPVAPEQPPAAPATVERPPIEGQTNVARPKGGGAPVPVEQVGPGFLGDIPLAALRVDPGRFQYELDAIGEGGVSRQFEPTKAWDPEFAGAIQVWRDPADGQLYVVNGHHRYDLARRHGAQEIGVRVLRAQDAAEARLTGALTNIVEGNGTAVDAAKIFRDGRLTAEDLAAKGATPTKGLVRDGLALARLHRSLFDQVVRQEITIPRGVIIGSQLDETEQLALVKLLDEHDQDVSNEQLSELIRFVKGSGEAEVSQESLFGAETLRQNLAFEKAQLSSFIRKQLAKDRALFKYIAGSGRASRIEQAGAGTIDVEAASGVATEAASAEELYDRLSTRAGPVAQALNEAARRLAAGEKRSAIQPGLLAAVKEALRSEADAARAGRQEQGDPGPRASGRVDTGRVDQGQGAGSQEVDVEEPPPDPNQEALFDPRQRDIFGAEEAPDVDQGEMFTGRPNLAQQEQEARETLARLRPLVEARRATPEQRQRYLEALALVRRGSKMGEDELRARAVDEAPPELPGQGALFDPESPPADVRERKPSQLSLNLPSEEEVAYGDPDRRRLAIGRIRSVIDALSARRRQVVQGARSRRTHMDVRGQRVTSVSALFQFMRPFRDPDMEKMHVVVVSGTENRVVGRRLTTVGVIDWVSLLPSEDDARWRRETHEFMRWLKRLDDAHGPIRIAFVHNHPSGNPTPSAEDQEFTEGWADFMDRAFGRAGVVMGHLVIDDTTASWLRPGREHERIQLQGQSTENDWTVTGTRITGPIDVGAMAHPENVDVMAVYLLQGRVVAVVPHRRSSLRTMAEWVKSELRAHAANEVYISVRRRGRLYVEAIAAANRARNHRIVDVVEQGQRPRSARQQRRYDRDRFRQFADARPFRVREGNDRGDPAARPALRDEFGRFTERASRAEDAFGRSPRGEVADRGAAQAPLLAPTLSPIGGRQHGYLIAQKGPAKGLIWRLTAKVRPDRPVSWTEVRDALANITHEAYRAAGRVRVRRIRIGNRTITLPGTEDRTVPMRWGKAARRLVPKRARGAFYPFAEVIAVLKADNLATAAHEIGHAIEHIIFGGKVNPWTAKGPAKVGTAIQKELKALGFALYGSTKPAGGYKREGWAEWLRMWFGGEDVARAAPETTKWVESQFFGAYPGVARAMNRARDLNTRWREQGSRARAQASMIDPASPKERGKRALELLGKATSIEYLIESAQPLWRLSRAAEARLGRKLAPSEDPYHLHAALRTTQDARVAYMVERGMIDLAGNPTGPPLADIRPLVKGRRVDFLIYLWAHRAVALIQSGRDAGMSIEDARQIIQEVGSNEFLKAATIVWKWADGGLEYFAQSSAQARRAVEAIREKDVGYYVPLFREFQELDRAFGTGKRAAGGSPLQRLRGSGRRIKDPMQSLIAKQTMLVRAAHRRMVLEAAIKLRGISGMGHMIQEVPVDKVPAVSLSVGRILDEVNRSLGSTAPPVVDVTDAVQAVASPLDMAEIYGQMVTFFTEAQRPSGVEADGPILPVWEDGKIKWYQLDPELYDTLESMDVYRMPDVLGLPLMEMFLGKPAELFRAGTTGLRASFGLVWNMIRDPQTLMVNSRGNVWAPTLLRYWFRGMADAFALRATGKVTSEYMRAFLAWGGEMAQPLGQDIAHTRRASRRLFEGRAQRIIDIRNWLDLYRDVIQFPEAAPRIAELRAVARDVGWKPGTPISLDQSLEMLLALKQVTTDFTAAGRLGRIMNRIAPFHNAAIQGPRANLRAARRNPLRFAVRGLALTALTLALWWEQKDEEWYRTMPYRERFLHWHIPFEWDGTQYLIRIPRAFEVGLTFAALPEVLFDAWYRDNPRAVTEWFRVFRETSTPNVMPVLAGELVDQARNLDSFWKTPIDPDARFPGNAPPPEERFNEYTSRLAIALGDALDVSPRRIDHAVRGIFGPVAGDAIEGMELLFETAGLVGPHPSGISGRAREKEPADIPVVGRLFSRGGAISSRPIPVEDLYDRLELAQLRQNSTRNPETDQERQQRLQLEDAAQAVSALLYVRQAAPSAKARASLTTHASRIAESALRYDDAGAIDRKLFRDARKEFEPAKEELKERRQSLRREAAGR